VLPWLARSGLPHAQDHMMDAVQAYCDHDPNWLDIPLSNHSRPSETPLQRRSRIHTLLGSQKLMTNELEPCPDRQTALDLVSLVSRHNPSVFEETRGSQSLLALSQLCRN
jgi:hypothetical protein